jgi:hypothetical protein
MLFGWGVVGDELTAFFLACALGIPMLQMCAFGLLSWCHANNKKF